MTAAELKEKYPDVHKAVLEEGRLAGFEAGKAKGMEDMECPEKCKEDSKKEGAKAELHRIQSVKALSIPGHEALIETLMFDGETTGEHAAMKVLAAEKTLRESKLAAFQAEGKDIKVPVVEGAEQPSGAVDPNLPVEERAKAEWDKDPGLRAEFKDNFTAFLAFKKADEAGSVKILGRRK